jgi:DUF1009 family protein
MSYVALIAGQGGMPLKLIEEIHLKGKKVLLLGIQGITPKSLEEKVDLFYWAKIYQLGKARRHCLKHKVKEVVMAGLIRHTELFNLSYLFVDWVTLKALLSVSDFRANSICMKVIEIFQEKGIRFLSTTKLLNRYLAPKGFLTRNRPSKKIQEDIEFGIQLARELGRLDIGQTVVVKNKSVVALEAMEGTDQCIQRAGDIAGVGCVVVKLPKPDQDNRFDVPVIGRNTIEKLAKIKASCLAIAANKTLIIDDEVVDLANKLNVMILSVEI